MSLRTRLRHLEQRIGDLGDCPTCRGRRGWIVTRTATQTPDGSVVWDQPEPQPCARCGQVAEQIIEIILPVVNEPMSPSASATQE